MTICVISVVFLGTSGAQAVAAGDLFEQCPSVVSESVCQPDPTTMQQHFEIGAVTTVRGNGKINVRQMSKYKNRQVYNTVLLLSFSQL